MGFFKKFIGAKPQTTGAKPENISSELDSAVGFHRAGNYQQAEKICQQILAVDPENPDANHLLGLVALHQRDFDNAIQFFFKAIAKDPSKAHYYSNLGNALQQKGRFREAIRHCEKAISIQPDFFEAHNNLGNALRSTGRLDEAVSSYRQAQAINPDNKEAEADEAIEFFNRALSIDPLFAEVHYCLGRAFLVKGRAEEAATAFNKAINIKPLYADPHISLGDLYRTQDNLENAATHYQKALDIKPALPEVANNLGNILQAQGRMAEAEECFRKAISLKPEFATAYYNLGNVLQQQNKMDTAAECYIKALEINPEPSKAYSHIGLGNVLMGQGKLSQAVEYFRKIIAINPDDAYALNNLGVALQAIGELTESFECLKKAVTLRPEFTEAFKNLGRILYDLGKPAEAVKYYQKALTLKPDYAKVHSDYLMMLNYLSDVSSQEIYKESLKWDEQQTAGLTKNEFSKVDFEIDDRPLKIGYVSPDFNSHSVGYFFEPLLKAHNRKKYKIYCYSNVLQPDSVTERMRSEADQWTSIVGIQDEDAAGMIRNDGIDILVDLSGHSGKNRLLVFAYKPAPIQVTWLGYPNTTGMKALDYRFTDEIVDPIGEADALYSEKLIRLENGFLCYQPYESAPEVSSLPYKKEGIITFGSFNNLAKVNEDVIKLWAEILHAVPGSRLILKGAVNKQDIEKQYTEIFVKHGVLAGQVIFYEKTAKQEDHMALYSKVDIGLDPFPYNGTTTTCEALWMGVPVISLLGDRHASRVGASIMHSIGFEELLVAKTPGEYIEKASALALQADKLTEIRGSLRSIMQQSSLCDAEMFARTVEDAYTKMCEDYLKTG
jgi:predicted O-linked N-acetylglucosamine transferase (SPINDLY family)